MRKYHRISGAGQFAKTLSLLGFRKDYESATKEDTVRVYKATFGKRTVDVQLWSGGGHRASHMYDGVGTTGPTDFRTVKGMCAAILREITRTDNAKLSQERRTP